MAIGERIRFFRNCCGMTQKELGMLVGFSDKTADVRIAQYESGKRTPKTSLIDLLASQARWQEKKLCKDFLNTEKEKVYWDNRKKI